MRLTEEMVAARSKLSDLSKVKRLNCWGSELVDVSLLRKMPSVEVLSLSINKINSLADFQHCAALQELYIRQNDIRELNQICYLQSLLNLKNLWLGENPCANVDGYRLTVLRALPQLQKLDNVSVSEDELKEALRKGRVLSHPEDPPESDEDYVPQNQYQRYQDYPTESEYSPPQHSPVKHEPEYENDEAEEYTKDETTATESGDFSPPRQPSPPRRQESLRPSYSPEQEQYGDRRPNHYEQEYQKSNQYYEKSYPANNFNGDVAESSCRESKIVSSHSSNCIKEYTNGDKYPQVSHNYRHNDGSEISSHGGHDSGTRRERYSCPAALQPPFNRRPVTRNSNILSAVLCLVKELDYPSLEVVEMAIRCRMDELEE